MGNATGKLLASISFDHGNIAQSEEQAKGIIAKFDKDGDGKLDKAEWIKFVAEWTKANKISHDEVVLVEDLFEKFDCDEDGKVSFDEMVSAVDPDVVEALLKAVQENDWDAVVQLNGAHFLRLDHEQENQAKWEAEEGTRPMWRVEANPLHTAVESGALDVVCKLIDEFGFDANAQHPPGTFAEPVLMKAVGYHALKLDSGMAVVEALVSRGADPVFDGFAHSQPLGKLVTMDVRLREKSAAVGRVFLEALKSRGDLAATMSAADKQMCSNSKHDYTGGSLLHFAVFSNNIPLALVFLEYGACPLQTARLKEVEEGESDTITARGLCASMWTATKELEQAVAAFEATLVKCEEMEEAGDWPPSVPPVDIYNECLSQLV